MSIADRKYADVIDELEWHFNVAESAIGVRSSWETMVYFALHGGGEGWEDPNDEGRLRAVRRQRRMVRAMSVLSDLQARALFAVHGTTRLHPYVTKHLNKMAGVAYVLQSRRPKGLETLERLCTKVATNPSELTPKEKLELSQLRIETIRFYENAIESLAVAWRTL